MATPDGRVPVPGSERAPVAGARAAGAVPGDEHVEVTVVVRYHAGSKPLGSTARFGVPAPGERKYLTREQLAEASGADPADIRAVEDFAAEHGLTVLDSDPARRTVSLAGTAAQMTEAFGVTLERYEHADGAYRGRTGAVHIPPELADIVEAVLGLDDRPAASPRLRVGIPVGDRAADPRAVAASFTPVAARRPLRLPGRGRRHRPVHRDHRARRRLQDGRPEGLLQVTGPQDAEGHGDRRRRRQERADRRSELAPTARSRSTSRSPGPSPRARSSPSTSPRTPTAASSTPSPPRCTTRSASRR